MNENILIKVKQKVVFYLKDIFVVPFWLGYLLQKTIKDGVKIRSE
jgi:hypothetical protein